MDKRGFGYRSLPAIAKRGLKKVVTEDKPFFASPLFWGANKLFGKKKVDEAYWKAVSPLVKGDIFLGSLAKKITPKRWGKTLWETPTVLPAGKKSPKGLTGVEYSIPSITSPVKKLGPMSMGLLGTAKLEEVLEKRKKNQAAQTNQNIQERQKMNKEKPLIKAADLQKAALMLSHLKDENASLIKKAKATELLYKQAEMGQIQFPKTHCEYQEKIAELMSKNLDVVEEAIKMASSSEPESLGGLHKEKISSDNPHSIFAKSVIEN